VSNPLSGGYSSRVDCSAAGADSGQAQPEIGRRAAAMWGLERLAPVEELECDAILIEVVYREIATVAPVSIGDRDNRVSPNSALDPKLGAPE
jgi:hypothetical protein